MKHVFFYRLTGQCKLLLSFQPNLETNLEANVRQVAEFHRTQTSKGMYSLNDGCRELFNPFFYHYSKSDQSKAEDYQRLHRKNTGLDLGKCNLHLRLW